MFRIEGEDCVDVFYLGPSKINVFPRSLLWLDSVFLAEQSHSSWDILQVGSLETPARVKTVSWLSLSIKPSWWADTRVGHSRSEIRIKTLW